MSANIKIQISDNRGYLTEILRNDEESFTGFGQVYCTATYPGVVKGWHKHAYQTDQIFCVKGMLQLVTITEDGEIKEYFIGEKNPVRVTVPPGVWHGWKTIGPETSLVINIPDKVYDYSNPDEIRSDPHSALPDSGVVYDWNKVDK